MIMNTFDDFNHLCTNLLDNINYSVKMFASLIRNIESWNIVSAIAQIFRFWLFESISWCMKRARFNEREHSIAKKNKTQRLEDIGMKRMPFC